MHVADRKGSELCGAGIGEIGGMEWVRDVRLTRLGVRAEDRVV